MTPIPHAPPPMRRLRRGAGWGWRVGSVALTLMLLPRAGEANDILRGGAPARAAADSSGGGAAADTPAPATAPTPSALDRLARTAQALTAVRQMQDAARKLAIAGPNNLRPNLPSIPLNSYGQPNGLVLAPGVPKDLLKPTPDENPLLWTGAELPEVSTQTSTTNGTTTTTSNVGITQTQQQAMLTWQSFNVGRNTTVTFDQSAGGADAGQWIAFNYVRDPSGVPSQILGSIRTVGAPDAQGHEQVGGQVYLMNSNGIIFGGSSQVNVHALVASSLPINYNLIQRGLLNNPDAQFQFSAVPQPAGSKGPTDGFDPGVASTEGFAPVQTPYATDGSGDVGTVYGDVVVQPGARLTAPTNADHVGGRIALIGPNVTNAGTISTEDGQTILAAGLQVGFTAHNSADPTLRGLDVFVGKIADASLPDQPAAGVATNAGLDATNLGVTTGAFNTAANNPGALNVLGLISAPRGSIYITGAAVNQSGVIDSSTSVAYNGRVDLVAGYNAVSNPKYDPNSVNAVADFTTSLPFYYQSNVGNSITGAAVPNSGAVTLGRDGVIRILPETESTDRVVGDLTLPSQVNIQGGSVHFAANATLLAPGAAVPLAKAYGADGTALDAGVAIHAGAWFNPGGTTYRLVQSDDSQQIYFDKGAAIDVAGLAGVEASVTENIVPVELRGSELAGSPLQRDGPLRGQTVYVDVRQHGPWDPTLNGGRGGYTWVGTPLADTSGWVGLTTHSVAELATNGGSVSLKAGGAMVLQPGATIDVSGGSIDYQGGFTHTTQLLSAGHVYDISKSSPDIIYDGVYTGTSTTFDPKWGISESTFNALATGVHENGYTQAGSGGSLAISAPVVALGGTLKGNTASGALQRTLSPLYNPASPPDPANPQAIGVPKWLVNAINLPVPSQFSLTLQRQYLPGGGSDYLNYSPTPANITFRSSPTLTAVEDFRNDGAYRFPVQRNYQLDLSPSLVDGDGAGFGILRIDNSNDDVGASSGYGSITVARGTMLELPVAGSLKLSAANIVIEDNTKPGEHTGIGAPSGSIELNAFDISQSLADSLIQLRAAGAVPADQVPTYDSSRGGIVLGTGSTLATDGEVVDDRPQSLTANTAPLISAGGAVTLKASDLTLKTGSLVDVSGGGTFATSGKFTAANAGSITLNAGQAQGGGFGAVPGGDLQLTGARLQGYAGVGKTGGALAIQAPSISVQALKNNATVLTDAATGALQLAPAFFNAGGISSFTLTGLGVAVDAAGELTGEAPALVVAAKTTVQPRVQSWQSLPGGAVMTADEGVREAAKLTFKSAALLNDINGLSLDNDISLLVDTGAMLATDPGGSVTLSGATIDLLGQITARGGKIALTQNGDSSHLYLPDVHLGPASRLDASGTVVSALDFMGYHKSNVLDGGTIALKGNIVAETGSVLNVSGASDTVLLSPGDPTTGTSLRPGALLMSAVKDSNGGSITLEGNQVLFSDATLLGGAGQPLTGQSTARGGSLTVISNRSAVSFADSNTLPGPLDPVLIVAASTPTFRYAGLGSQVTDAGGTALGDSHALGLVWFGADRFNAGDFGKLTLRVGQGALQVQGNVSLLASREIDLADSGVLSLVAAPRAPATARTVLSLSAPYVVLGRPFQGPLRSDEKGSPFSLNVAPTNGNGVLSVQAGSLIDVGTLVLRGIGSAILDATQGGTTSGSIRGDGTLDVAGAITLKAGQIYPPTATEFNVIASDYLLNGVNQSGSITVQSANSTTPAPLPLSAGGALNLYASTIDQGGVLRAPLGMIRLGTTGGSGTDPISGQVLPATSTLTLEPGSITSVSAVDPLTGKPITIPYGINVNGDTWVDPTGTDITNVGPTAKSITLTAGTIDFKDGTTTVPAAGIDLTGGGDLYAYQFVPGTGGKTDILLGGSAGAFAIVPGYGDVFAPYAPYDGSTDAKLALGNDPGYVSGNASLNYTAGDRIHLQGAGGLPDGDYTLLPARYALLPGAYLVTPLSGTDTAGPARSVTLPDGSTVSTGYRFNGFDPAGTGQSQFRSYEVAPQAVVLKRAEYDGSSANTFFTDAAKKREAVSPRLPLDAGQLVFVAGATLHLQGDVAAQAAKGGRGGLVDISSTADILIGSSEVIADRAGTTGTLLLDAKELSSFGADSLLVGGVRTFGDDGTTVSVKTDRLTVDNAGETLTGSDVILVANKRLIVVDDADIQQTRTLSTPADTLLLEGAVQLDNTGDNNVLTVTQGGGPIKFPSGLPAGTSLMPSVGGTITKPDGTTTTFTANTAIATLSAGSTVTLSAGGTLTASFNAGGDPIPLTLADGALVRVSSDPAAAVVRNGVAFSSEPVLAVGPGARVRGSSVILDSTAVTAFASPEISGTSLTLGSGQISVQLAKNSGPPPTTTGLALDRDTLQSLLEGTESLSLLSYSSIDLYGDGPLGLRDDSGAPLLNSLSLHAGGIRGFSAGGGGGNAELVAKTIRLDNSANVASPGAAVASRGSLTLDAGAGTIELGANVLAVDQYDRVQLNAGGGILLQDSGGLAVQHDLALATSLISGETGARQAITAGGRLTTETLGATPKIASTGLGAQLELTGTSVAVNSDITLHSGSLRLHATDDDVQVGDTAASHLDLSGTKQSFYDVDKYTGGGRVVLVADNGSVRLAENAVVDVSALAGGGGAGDLAVAAPNGTFELAEGAALHAQGGVDGRGGPDGASGGAFALDVGELASTSALDAALDFDADTGTGGFGRSRSIRVRTGDVTVDGTAIAHAYNLSADQGAITVAETGRIDASGVAVDPVSGQPVDVAAKLADGTWKTDGTGRLLDQKGQPVELTGGTGGTIALAAGGSVTLQEGAVLTVAGTYVDAAGKGGAVSLEAGSTQNGVAPSTTDTRDPATGVFRQSTTPVVDIQAGSTIDLSVATQAIALAAGESYSVPRASVSGDLLAADTGGVITKADGTTVAFAAGLLPALEAGSRIALNADGRLTYLADGAKGTFTGTLHLRAPQTTPVQPTDPLLPRVAPDVQINPIDGAIVDPSSIVVEGYKVYQPTGGYVESAEVDIDTNGQAFASAANTSAILQNLTKNWGSGANQANGLLGKQAGAQLHVRPGAEVIGSTEATVNTITYAGPPGAANSLAVPAGATLTLTDTSSSTPAASTNDLLFSTATTLTAVDNGSYKNSVTSIGPATSATTPPLAVLADTSIKVGASAVTTGKLTSTVGGTITPASGAPTTFAAGVLPTLPVNSTVTFNGPGTVSSATSSNATSFGTLTVQNSFKAGVAINLPANSTVTLSTKGGKVTFAVAGNLTWSTRAAPTNTFAVQVPSDGSLFTTGTGGTVITTSGGRGTGLTLSGTGTITLSAGGSLVLPQGTFTSTNTSTTALNALQVGSATGATSTYVVTIKAAQGGTLTFPNAITGSVTTQKGGTQKLAKNTLDATGVQLDAGGSLVFGASAQISASIGGVITLPTTALNNTGITIPGTGGTITIPAGSNLAAGALTATVGGTITAADGTVRTFAAGAIPLAISGGSVLTLTSGKVALSSSNANAVTVTVTNNLAASTSTAIAANSTVRFTSAGTVATVSGTVSNVTITNNLLPGKVTPVSRNDVVTLASAADVATVTSNTAFNLASNGPTSLVLAAGNPTASKVSFITGSGSMLATVASGSYTTTGATGIIGPVAGDLTLASAWDLSTFRYGPNVDANKPGSGEPGMLTLRAPGNVVFSYSGYNPTSKILAAGSLSDGFGPAPTAANGGLWQASLLTGGAQSWSYRLVAGADLTAADHQQVQSLAALGSSGSVQLGRGAGALATPTPSSNITRSFIIPQYYQTIRTGTGDIDISAGRDIQLLNSLASIYTAGTSASALGNFDLPSLGSGVGTSATLTPYYPAQYSLAGGEVSLRAQNDIGRFLQTSTGLVADSSKEMPTNWLYRRGNVGPDGRFTSLTGATIPTTEIQSTSWWVDFSNFFSDVGALGGGNVTLTAGRNVSNINAAVPTNARMPGKDASGSPVAPDLGQLVELGGGDLVVQAGANVDGGVYYVERGSATVEAGGSVTSNATRAPFTAGANVIPERWLPTTFFLGKGSVDVSAVNDVRVGQVANPFWLPQGANNRIYENTYFSTFDPADTVSISSLVGSVTLQGQPSTANASSAGSAAWLLAWYASVLSDDPNAAAATRPWLRLSTKPQGSPLSAIAPFRTVAGVLPGTLSAVAFSDDVNLVGSLTLSPSPNGSLDLLAAGNINGFQVNGSTGSGAAMVKVWGSATINLSDADPDRLPSLLSPLSFATYTPLTPSTVMDPVNALFAEAGTPDLSLEQRLALHAQGRDDSGDLVPLHYQDEKPVHLYASDGDLSGLTFYSAKSAKIVASHDITDISLYLQNVHAEDVSLVAAGRDIIAYDPSSPLRVGAQKAGNLLPGEVGDVGPSSGTPTAGDIQIAGPGTLEVLSGRDLVLGSGNNPERDGTAAGILSVGAVRNPALPRDVGAEIVALAGAQSVYTSAAAGGRQEPGLATTPLHFTDFVEEFLDPDEEGSQAGRYLPVLGAQMGLTTQDPAAIWEAFGFRKDSPLTERQAVWLLGVFQRILRDAGRDRNDESSPNFHSYTNGLAAIQALFPGSPEPDAEDLAATDSSETIERPAGPWAGDISLATREIKTSEGSSITLLVPGGGITVGRPTDPQKADQGVLTERGGGISIYAADSVNVGTSRIFTLRGGNEVIWSTWGNIAAGSGSKTVFSAPPTRVLIDPQSADVKNDLAGLATGSGIGVLATLSGVKPGDVDLIAPIGTIDAGDAGIRASGNVNLAARVVLNAGNIQTGGTLAGAPPPPAAPNIGGLTAASNSAAAASSTANEVARQGTTASQTTVLPSLITVEVLGYGGDEGDDIGAGATDGTGDDDRKKDKEMGDTR